MPLFRIALFGEKLHYGLSDMYQSSDEFLFYYSHAAARLQLLHNEEKSKNHDEASAVKSKHFIQRKVFNLYSHWLTYWLITTFRRKFV